MSDLQSLLEFPCFYTFKIFGRQSEEFAERVRAIVSTTLGPVPLDSMKVRESGGGRYLSVTIEMRVHSRAQLESIYADLRAEERVLLYL